MAKKVFFSFHYQDVIDFRANVVRNSWLCQHDREAAGFFDSSLWESSKRTGDDALKRLINNGLLGTSTTAVLIGEHTFSRRWVRYEIVRSMLESKKLLGIHINGIKCRNQQVKANGSNPFEFLGLQYSADGRTASIYEWSSGQWVSYPDTRDTLNINGFFQHAGNFLQLSQFYSIYDWCQHDGFNNFGSWVNS